MSKWLLAIGIVVGVLTGLGFVSGISTQQAIGFGLAVLCGLPITTFFLGGAFFTFMAVFKVVPRASTFSSNQSRQTRSAGVASSNPLL